MRRSRKTLWWRVAVGVLTLPLLQTSCVEIAQRSTVNGVFDAVIPLLDEQVADCAAETWFGCEES